MLAVEASAGGAASATRRLASMFIDTWSAAYPGASVLRRDVAADPIPHVGADFLRNMREAPDDEASRSRKETARRTEILRGELLGATHLLIASPMHIFSMPSSVKAWADHIFHEGVVFEASEQGIRGLLDGLKVVLVTSRGGDYRPPSPLAEFDMLSPYFRKLFEFCGVSDFQSFDVHNGMFDPPDHAGQVDALLQDIVVFARKWE